mgnify:FL=1
MHDVSGAAAPGATDVPGPLRGLGGAVVLMYHDVTSPGGPPSGFEGPGPERYKVGAASFARHLDLLPGGDPPVVLTFDDGGASAHHPIADMLEGRGMRGVFLVTTGRIGTPGFLGREPIADLHRRGHVVGSHTVTHPHWMSRCSPAALAREWGESVAALEDIVGAPVACASVAGGHYSDAVGRAAAAAGIRTLFTSAPTRRAAAVDGCRLIGRYVVTADTPDATVARLARGDRVACARRAAAWRARSAARAVLGPAYERVRSALLARGR